jgi:hypothetical protein
MSETSTYEGSCHCGAVRFTVTMAPPTKAYACNCSMCRRAGWLFTFVPGDQVTFLTGEGELTDYQFGNKHIHHLFCRTCGVRSFSRGKDKNNNPTVALNLRCLTGLDPTTLPIENFDGASL